MSTQVLPPYLTASTFTVTISDAVQTGVETVVVSSALPTQALPFYLSASTFTTTVEGVVTEEVSTVNVPLTYIGPSVSSLGLVTTAGIQGSTTPASIIQSSTQTAIPSSSSSQTSFSTQTAIPSSSSTQSSSSGVTVSSPISISASNLPSGSSSVLSSTQIIPSSSIASSAAPSSSSSAPVVMGISSKGLSAGQLAGIIIAAVVAWVVVVMLFTLWYYCRKRHRSDYEHPNLSDFVIVDAEGQTRLAGEGVPRPTGEEEDSFLRRSNEARNGMREVDPSARLVVAPSPTGTERTTGTTMPPEGVIPSAFKTPTSPPSPSHGPKLPSPFFHASAASLFFHPSRGPDQSLIGAAGGTHTKRDSGSTGTRGSSSSASPVSYATIGNIIPPRQLLQMDDQWRQETADNMPGTFGARRGTTELGERRADQIVSPLRPLPTLNDDTNPSIQISLLTSMRTTGSQPDSPGSDDERATLLMAQRVNMNEGSRVLVRADNGDSSQSSWHSSLEVGLRGLTRISRLSWFQRTNVNLAQHTPASYMSARHTPRTRSGSPMQQLRSAENRLSLGVLPRPVSNLTISSTGETLFYDAHSGPSSMSTRSGHGHNLRPTSMPPFPPCAVITPVDAGPSSAPQTPGYVGGSDSASSLNHPALLMLYPSDSAPASPNPAAPGTEAAERRGEPIDILDTPVPARAAVSPFSSASTRGGPAVPPGLEHLANVRSWRDSSSDMPSSATFGTVSDRGVNITSGADDALEDAPPLPRQGWSILRSVTTSTTESSRRALEHHENLDLPDDHHSAAASLHSIPDRLSPLSPLGSGSNSRAPSRHTQYHSSSLGSGSNSSHFAPSPLGGSGTGGSSGSRLCHSNSVSSDGRRRARREPGEPLSPSVYSSEYRRARLSAIGVHRTPMTTPQRSPAVDGAFGSLLGRTT